MVKHPGTDCWRCCFCGLAIRQPHHPLAVSVRITNLYKDEDLPTTAWETVFAHAECVTTHIHHTRKGGIDLKGLLDDIPVISPNVMTPN